MKECYEREKETQKDLRYERDNKSAEIQTDQTNRRTSISIS